MKHKHSKVIYILFFIAAVFFAAFVLAEFRRDYLSIALAAIVMLVAAYFLVDKIERDIYEKYDFDKEDLNEKYEDTSSKLKMGFSKIDQLEEAIRAASMQGYSDPNKKLTEMLEQMTEVENTMLNQNASDSSSNSELLSVVQAQGETIALLKNGFKTLIQFSKENARQVALNTNEQTNRLLQELDTAVTELKTETKEVDSTVAQIKQSSEEEAKKYQENITLIDQRLEKIESLMSEISTSLHQ